ncbi:putative Type 1 protein exporter [Helianthus annuus]|nr:putative Type 1 protein exporter [Helianthus annuus]
MHSNVMTPRSMDVVFKRLSFAIQKGVAAQLVARLPTISMSLGQSFSNLGAFSKGKAVGYKLLEIIKQKPTIVQDSTDGKCLTEVNGNIEFKDVSFSYLSRPNIFIFRNFSIFFPAGKTVAVVGGSWSGKSSAIALIERFYDPNQGHILLDNVDIKTLQLKWLRDQIGLVNQEPALLPPRFSNTYFTENRMQLQLKSKLQPRLPTLTASLPCFLMAAIVITITIHKYKKCLRHVGLVFFRRASW